MTPPRKRDYFPMILGAVVFTGNILASLLLTWVGAAPEVIYGALASGNGTAIAVVYRTVTNGPRR